MLDGHPQRKPVWQRSWSARLASFVKQALPHFTFTRFAIVVVALPLLLFIYREVTRDALIIDPFTVPKRLEEAGLTPEVMANRIGDALRHIEATTETRMKKDNLTALREEGGTPDVEIPGTKVGLKTVIDITRAVVGIYPKHLGGDIVIPVDSESQATVTFYITQGRNRSEAMSLVTPALDVELLARRTAELVLGQVNPYILAVYRKDRKEFDEAVVIVQRIIQDPAQERLQKSAAFNLWGLVLFDQKRYDEAVAKYKKVIELDPRDKRAYNNWGIVLREQKRYEEAIAKYQKAIEFDPKYALAYSNWGLVLDDQKRYDDAVAKHQKAIELDPKYARAYGNWGVVLHRQKKYDEAVSKYQKAIELDPSYASAYNNWGIVLTDQGKYDEAIAKYQKAIELDPKYASAYINWGFVLLKQQKYTEAVARYQKAIELEPKSASAYYNLGIVLNEQKKYDEAAAKFAKARELSPSQETPILRDSRDR